MGAMASKETRGEESVMGPVTRLQKRDPLSKGARLSRRGFVKLGVWGFVSAAFIEVVSLITQYLAPRATVDALGGTVDVGEIGSFPLTSVTAFPKSGFFLVRAADGGFLAVYRRCPHLGCAVVWQQDSNLFHCPCHASSFDMFGDFTRPPVPRALAIFPVAFEDGNVLVDTSNLTIRDYFHPDQIAYPGTQT